MRQSPLSCKDCGMMGPYKYKAFISYSHKDDRWGRWLHRRLENYRLPRNIVGNVTKTGAIPRRLRPIFRDREELSAANDLGDKIEQALRQSENLIMICSPAAARSHWVNQEILFFKRQNRDAQVFSVIVEGEPYASNIAGREDEECFPLALRFELDENGGLSDTPAEPLAADLRDHGDGKRLGVLKLISGMIGVGLDEVVQRDMKKSRNRVIAITTTSLATVLAMGTLTVFALDARNDAEGLIDFMQTDLKDRLVPVGRTDILEDVAKKSLEYYESKNTTQFGCGASGRHARSLQFSSEVNLAIGNIEAASENANEAAAITEKQLTRCADRPETLIDHSNSLYYQSATTFDVSNLEDFHKKTEGMQEFVDRFCAYQFMKSSKQTHEEFQKLLDGQLETCLTNKAYVQINLGAGNLWGRIMSPKQSNDSTRKWWEVGAQVMSHIPTASEWRSKISYSTFRTKNTSILIRFFLSQIVRKVFPQSCEKVFLNGRLIILKSTSRNY